MDVNDIIVGEKVFIKSIKFTENTYGANIAMRRFIGKFKTVLDKPYEDSIKLEGGYTWHPGDLSLDNPA
jgi:hypothetical protein